MFGFGVCLGVLGGFEVKVGRGCSCRVWESGVCKESRLRALGCCLVRRLFFWEWA